MAGEKRLIYADAAAEAVCYNCMDKHDCQDRCSDYMEVFNVPTVDAVEVVHGRWEDRENPQWKAYDIRHCSVCGWNIPKTKLRQKDSHWNYCPNCGARMDGDSR